MIRAHAPSAVRAAERPLLEAGEPLMLRAASALAARAAQMLEEEAATAPARTHGERRVLALVGPGSNGGDGLHAAAMLRARGVGADALLVLDRAHPGGADALRAAGGELLALAQLEQEELRERIRGADLLLDAMLGTGGRPEAPAALHTLLDLIAQLGAEAPPVLAVDVPSFADCASGAVDPRALPARATLTFGAPKSGLLLPPLAHLAGPVETVDLGLEPHLPRTPALERLETADAARLWRRPRAEDSKYTRGVVGVVAGSDAYPGAAVLACAAAARTGAGMVRCLAPRRVLDLVLGARPEVVGHEIAPGDGLAGAVPERTDALVVGPGLDPEDPRVRSALELLAAGSGSATEGGSAAEGGPTAGRGVIDAGALGAIDPGRRFGPDVVLTPHAGEARRLAERLGIDPDQAPAELARALAAASGATVLLKGAVTVIAAPGGGPLRSQADGVPQLATAGTGDVLSGVIGALLAAGQDGPEAAALGALLHGRAGALAAAGGAPLVAGDLPSRLPAVLATILTATSSSTRGER